MTQSLGDSPIFYTIHNPPHGEQHRVSELILEAMKAQRFNSISLKSPGEYELLTTHALRIAIFDYEADRRHVNQWRIMVPTQNLIAPPWSRLASLAVAVSSRSVAYPPNAGFVARQIYQASMERIRQGQLAASA